MKLGIILFIIGVILVAYLSNMKIKKRVVKQIGIIFGIIMAIYGIIIFAQPDEDTYIKFTKTTVSKETKVENNK